MSRDSISEGLRRLIARMKPSDKENSKAKLLSEANESFEEDFRVFSESAELILSNLSKANIPFATEKASLIYARVEKALAAVEVNALEYRIFKTRRLIEKTLSLMDADFEDDLRFVSEQDGSELDSIFAFERVLEGFNKKQREYRESELALEKARIALSDVRSYGEQLEGELAVAKGLPLQEIRVFERKPSSLSESESERLSELQLQKNYAQQDLHLLKEDLNSVRMTLELLKSRNPKTLTDLRLRELKMVREARTRLSRRKNSSQFVQSDPNSNEPDVFFQSNG